MTNAKVRIGFVGGQMPLLRRIPKRGFCNKRFTSGFIPVKVSSLYAFDNGARVD